MQGNLKIFFISISNTKSFFRCPILSYSISNDQRVLDDQATGNIKIFKKHPAYLILTFFNNALKHIYNYLPYCTTKYIFVLGKNKFDIQCHPTISWMY